VRTLNDIDSDLIIKHESPVMITEIESAAEFEKRTKNPLGQVRRLIQQHWKMIG